MSTPLDPTALFSVPLLQHPGEGYPGIARALRVQILGGALTPGIQLPPISELAQQAGTTAITVRRALRMLEDEGLVRVEHGVGTFVADWARQYDLLALPSFSAEMATRHVRLETRVCRRDLAVRAPEAAAALGLPSETEVAVLDRLRVIDATPFVYQHSYLEMGLRDVVEAYSPEHSLYELLPRRTRRFPYAADESIRAVALPEAAAAMLRVAAGSPGWCARRTTFDAEGRPLVYDVAYFPGKRIELQSQRRAGQTVWQYRILDVT